MKTRSTLRTRWGLAYAGLIALPLQQLEFFVVLCTAITCDVIAYGWLPQRWLLTVPPLQALYKQMVEVMRGFGIEAVPTVGAPFDPEIHEAIMREPSEEVGLDSSWLEFGAKSIDGKRPKNLRPRIDLLAALHCQTIFSYRLLKSGSDLVLGSLFLD